ncbi:MAG: leucyl/phenylalanyl-tRNA--protein transferase [Flammeovirgaceae bacterium]
MPFYLDIQNIQGFPPVELADRSGLLAVGGDLSPERLILAYSMGIFPWFNQNEPILWWSPNPRFILFPEKVIVSKSMKQILRAKKYQVTFDQNFPEVIKNCQKIYRPKQNGTWITDEIVDSYIKLHEIGFIHSVEVWEENQLVGGLYGGAMGKCFFGESMFAKKSNASKVGFLTLVRNLQLQNYQIIDCQVYTKHLESLGAEKMPRSSFLKYVTANAQTSFEKENWNLKFQKEFEW